MSAYINDTAESERAEAEFKEYLMREGDKRMRDMYRQHIAHNATNLSAWATEQMQKLPGRQL